MTSTTQANERPPGIPEWLDMNALAEKVGGKLNVDYRTEYGPQGRLLADALARWVRSMLDVAQQPNLEVIDDDVAKAITDALGFEALDYVLLLTQEIYESLYRATAGKAPYSSWSNDDEGRGAVWAEKDPPGWFDMRLAPAEAIGYVEQWVESRGGSVTWPEGGAR